MCLSYHNGVLMNPFPEIYILYVSIHVHLCFFLQDFPEKSWEPKVQLPYKAEPGQVPRKIEIERLVSSFFLLIYFHVIWCRL